MKLCKNILPLEDTPTLSLSGNCHTGCCLRYDCNKMVILITVRLYP